MSVDVIYRGRRGRKVDDFTVPKRIGAGTYEAWVGDIIECNGDIIAVLFGDPDYIVEPEADEWADAEPGTYDE